MARSSLTDYLQNYSFWLMDVAPIEPLALPIFTPLMGFSSITAPEMTIEVQEITEANWLYGRKVAKRASVNDITLTRAAKWYDSDFYKWIMATLSGNTGGRGSGTHRSLAIGGATPRRTLLLVNFLAHSPLPTGGAAEAASAAGLLAIQGTVTGMVGGAQSLGPGFIGGALATGAAAAGTALGTSFGPAEFAPRLPAKAWVLYDCLDEETEILSEEGWVGSDDVGEGSLVYSLNVDMEKIELVPVDGYVIRAVGVGEYMVGVEGRSINFRTTGRHGFYLRRNGSSKIRRVTGDELFDMSGEYQIPVSGRMDFDGVPLTDDELRFVAWYVTDGHLKESQRLIISQSKGYKDEIRALLQRLGIHFTERVVPGGSYANAKPRHEFGIPKGTGSCGLRGWWSYREYLNKNISPLLHKMTREQFLVFWKELIKGDGSFDRGEELGGSHLWCSAKPEADAVMRLGVLRGVGMSMYESVTEHGHTMYCVTATDREWMLLRPKRLRSAKGPLTRTLATPGERVWCVSNRNKTLITRRYGKVSILGNCIPTRYKVSGDFDAMTSDIALQELDIAVEHWDELSLGSDLAPVVAIVESIESSVSAGVNERRGI
jgi:hypothetical protein